MESRTFYFEVCRLINSINNRYDEYAKIHGIVSYLTYGDGYTQSDICKHCQLPKTTVNTIIKNLEKREYIALISGDDKRQRLVSLTETGKKYADDLLNDLFSREDIIFDDNKKELLKMIDSMNLFDQLLRKLVN